VKRAPSGRRIVVARFSAPALIVIVLVLSGVEVAFAVLFLGETRWAASLAGALLGVLAAYLAVALAPRTVLTLDRESQSLTVATRRPPWRGGGADVTVHALARARAVGVRGMDDSGFERLVLIEEGDVERMIAFGRPADVCEAARELNDELRARYEKEDDVPEVLTKEMRALDRRARAADPVAPLAR